MCAYLLLPSLTFVQVVASVVMKLCGGSGDRSAYKEELNVDTFLSQVSILYVYVLTSCAYKLLLIYAIYTNMHTYIHSYGIYICIHSHNE